MQEDTIIKTLDLPEGREWAWFADANILCLSPALCPEGRMRAVREAQDWWRRRHLQAVRGDVPVVA